MAIKKSQSEYEIQRGFCTFARAHSLIFFSTPNERKSSPLSMNKLKASGLKPGVPDIAILANDTIYFIEFKKPGGKLSAHQKEFHKILKGKCYNVAVCYSVNDAEKILKKWEII